MFRQVSIMSLTCVIMATWEYLFTANSRGLLNGGPAGMIWSYIWTLTGFGLMVVSLAELSSMVSELMIRVRYTADSGSRHRMFQDSIVVCSCIDVIGLAPRADSIIGFRR